MSDFVKIIRIGKQQPTYSKVAFSTFCKIEYEGGRLSISGVEGPKANGDAHGSCGQIDIHEWAFVEYAPGWDANLVDRFRQVWRKWHLNDMLSNCEHQIGEAWEPREVSIYHFTLTAETIAAKKSAETAAMESLKKGTTFTPTSEQARIARLPYSITSHLPDVPEFYEAAKQTSYSRPVETKKTNWLKESEHPDGFMSKPCPVCGYRYGSAWLKKEVPTDVLDFLRSLPDTDIKPVWI